MLLLLPSRVKSDSIHEGLAKAESSLAMQIHTEKIGLADFLEEHCVTTYENGALAWGMGGVASTMIFQKRSSGFQALALRWHHDRRFSWTGVILFSNLSITHN